MNSDFNLGGGMPDLSKPSIDPRDYKTVKCSKCGGIIFRGGMVLKEIPGSAVGRAGEPIIYPLQVLVCDKCGEIFEEDVKSYKLEKDISQNKLSI